MFKALSKRKFPQNRTLIVLSRLLYTVRLTAALGTYTAMISNSKVCNDLTHNCFFTVLNHAFIT
jgi:hypothetical protein